MTIQLSRVVCPGGIDERWQHIHYMGWIANPLIASADAQWPMSDEGCADAAFVREVLVETEGGIAQICPATAVRLMRTAPTDVPELVAGVENGLAPSGDAIKTKRSPLVTGSIVTEKQD